VRKAVVSIFQLTPSINTSGDGNHGITGHSRNFSARAEIIGRNKKGLNIVVLQGSINTSSTSGVINVSLFGVTGHISFISN
jgi:hypothetical protein